MSDRTGKFLCIDRFFTVLPGGGTTVEKVELSFVPGPLLGQTVSVADGVSVRLRLAHFSDRRAIGELLADHGGDFQPDPLRADGLVQFDPRRRYVLCACALIGSTERLVGLGAIDLRPGAVPEPEFLVIDRGLQGADGSEITEALAGLLRGALIGAAQAMAHARAA